jgi:hypothetical protein
MKKLLDDQPFNCKEIYTSFSNSMMSLVGKFVYRTVVETQAVLDKCCDVLCRIYKVLGKCYEWKFLESYCNISMEVIKKIALDPDEIIPEDSPNVWIRKYFASLPVSFLITRKIKTRMGLINELKTRFDPGGSPVLDWILGYWAFLHCSTNVASRLESDFVFE